MFLSRDSILSFILATNIFTSLASTAPTNIAPELETRYDGISYVYRADKRGPGEITKAKGMWAKGYSIGSKMGADISLFNHANGDDASFASQLNDGFVSFSSSKEVAEGWVDKYLGGQGYVYEVHTYGNLIDVQATLKSYNPHPKEKEFAAIRGVEFDQIKGWNQYTPVKGKSAAKKPYVANTKYNQAKYSKKEHGGAQYALAGFPKGHKAWKEDPWYFYASCAAITGKRTTTTTTAAAAKDMSGNDKVTCGPAKTNQAYAQAYVDAVDAGKTFSPTRTH